MALTEHAESRDALTGVKEQLEAEIQQKDKELKECKEALDVKDQELARIREDYDQQILDLSAECERAKQQAEDAARYVLDVCASVWRANSDGVLLGLMHQSRRRGSEREVPGAA